MKRLDKYSRDHFSVHTVKLWSMDETSCRVCRWHACQVDGHRPQDHWRDSMLTLKPCLWWRPRTSAADSHHRPAASRWTALLAVRASRRQALLWTEECFASLVPPLEQWMGRLSGRRDHYWPEWSSALPYHRSVLSVAEFWSYRPTHRRVQQWSGNIRTEKSCLVCWWSWRWPTEERWVSPNQWRSAVAATRGGRPLFPAMSWSLEVQ